MPISPDMLSPATLPVKASVSGIGLVIEIFQATSSPLTVPSKISPELPSAPCVPVSVPPALFTVSVALRSPIGVLMVMFQFPSTAIISSPQNCSQNRNGSGILVKLRRRYSAPRRLGNIPLPWLRRSGAGGPDAAADEHAEGEILHGERQKLGADQDHRDIDRPQPEIARQGDRDGAGAEREHQRCPGVAGDGNVFRNGVRHDRGHVTQHPAALQHDRADREMRDRGFCQHEAGIVGEDGGAAEHDHQRQTGIGHEAERLPLDPRIHHLRHRARDRHRRCQHHIAGGQIEHQEHDRREEIGAQSDEYLPHRFPCVAREMRPVYTSAEAAAVTGLVRR